jgi:NAD(P)-dependent dehydrogenase (short-subunit alcohol dehydrogenase family)
VVQQLVNKVFKHGGICGSWEDTRQFDPPLCIRCKNLQSLAALESWMMLVNCYTHLLVCLELFPLLLSTAAARQSPTRITFVGSASHITKCSLNKTPIPESSTILGYFDDETKFSSFHRYPDSKLVVNAYTRRLAALAPAEIVVNNLCPGLVQTGLDKNLPFLLRILMGLVRKSIGRTVEEGARSVIYASVIASPETNGKFLQHNKIRE